MKKYSVFFISIIFANFATYSFASSQMDDAVKAAIAATDAAAAAAEAAGLAAAAIEAEVSAAATEAAAAALAAAEAYSELKQHKHPYIDHSSQSKSLWWPLGSLDTDTYYVDFNSIKKEGTSKAIWIKIVGKLSSRGVPAWKGSVMERYLVECASSKIAMVARLTYNSQGRVASHVQNSNYWQNKFNYIVPESIGSNLAEITCQ